MEYPNYVDIIIDRLENAGYEAYIVGGGLRDSLLKRNPNDFDIATSAKPEETLSLFSDMRTIPTGLKHGTVTVLCQGEPIEITTFRVDGEYSDSRHPESVSFTSNICEDLARRDFTINAMAYNKKRGFVDPFGGVDDLKSGILRAVRDPELRMKEDALRIMRALRFSAQLGFAIEENTKKALGTMKEGLANISGERLGVELAKLVTAPYPKRPVEIMCELGISKYILRDYIPSERLLDTLSKLPPDFTQRLACLLWDCDSETITLILSSMKYSNEQKRAVKNVCAAKCFPQICNDADVRRFMLRFGKEADAAAKLRAMLSEDDALTQERLESVRKNEFCDGIASLSLGGDELVKMGIRGKDIGLALSAMLELVTEYPSKNTKDELCDFVKRKYL